MSIDPQKEALYAEITRRAGLYTHMLTLQRNGAPTDQLDLAIAAIGTAEAEIRRMSDEVNDRIWYENYGKMLGLLEKQAEILPQLLTGQKETHGSIDALSAQFRELAVAAQRLRADLRGLNKRHGDQIGVLGKDIADIKARLDRKRTELDEHAARLEALERDNARLVALEAAVERLAAGD